MPNLNVAEADGQPQVGAGVAAARPTLRFFAAARQAAGMGRVRLAGATVGAVLDAACATYGDELVAVLAMSRVWLNGEPARRDEIVGDGDEIAVLPPVSGGA